MAKFWLEPQTELAESYGMDSAELAELMKIADENKEIIRSYWNDHLGN